jgi:hypothetical protein
MQISANQYSQQEDRDQCCDTIDNHLIDDCLDLVYKDVNIDDEHNGQDDFKVRDTHCLKLLVLHL